jgi:bisanhydrobacterioruberin hydratase
MTFLTTIQNQRTVLNTSLLLIFYLVGLVGIYHSPKDFAGLTPLNLLISFILLYDGKVKTSGKTLFNLLGIWVTAYFLEMLGTNTGKIFGSYTYGDALGIKLLNTPIIIGLNWIIACYCSIQTASWIIRKSAYSKFAMKPIVIAALASVLMVFLDIFIEPIAPVLDFWKWEEDIIPFQNFAAWLIFGVFFCFWMFKTIASQFNILGVRLYLIQAVFFLLLNLLIG